MKTFYIHSNKILLVVCFFLFFQFASRAQTTTLASGTTTGVTLIPFAVPTCFGNGSIVATLCGGATTATFAFTHAQCCPCPSSGLIATPGSVAYAGPGSSGSFAHYHTLSYSPNNENQHLIFSAPITRFQFSASGPAGNAEIFKIETYLGSTLVGTHTFLVPGTGLNNTYNITGASFDRVEFIEINAISADDELFGDFMTDNPSGPTSTALAGPDQTLCTTVSATLAANTPNVGTGNWSVVSGPSTLNTQFSNPTLPNATFTPAAGEGSYVLRWTITNPTCNPSIDDVTITFKAVPTLNISPSSNQACPEMPLNLTATVGLSSYSWSASGGAFVSTTGSPTSWSTSNSGSYSFTVTANDGTCTATASASATVNVNPSVGINPASTQLCTGSSINLSGSGGNAYSWASSGGAFTSTSGSPVTWNASNSGGYSFTVTANDGTCTATASASATVNTNPSAGINPSSTSICAGSIINLSGSGGSTYSWSASGGTFISSTGSPTTWSASNSGSYSFTITANDGTCTATASASATVNANPSAGISPASTQLCTGQSLSLSVITSATGYSWAKSGVGFISSTSQATFSSSLTGGFSFSVTVSNSVGCTASASTSVTVITQPTVQLSPSTTQAICQGVPLNLTATGSAPFTWSGPSNYSSTNAVASLNTSSSSFSGVYKVTVGSGSCIASASVSVSIQQAALSVSPNPLTVCLGQTINLTANASPAASAFSWKGPGNFSSTTQNISTYATTTANLGIYSVSASIGSCVVTSTAEVKSGSVLQAGVVGIPCLGGTIQFTATGMTSYSWSRPTNNFNSTLQNPVIPSSTMNDAGIYFLSARSGSCFVSILVPVMIVGTGVNPAFSVSPSSFAAGTTVSLSAASATGTYAWSGPNSFSGNTRTKSISNFQAVNNGVYRLTLTSGACSGYTEKNISINSATRLATTETEPLDMEINAYPNPVTHTLTVEVRLKEPSALQLNLINSIGKDSGTWQLQEVTTFHKTELNLADLQGGVYLLQAQAGKQKVVKRVVKIQY